MTDSPAESLEHSRQSDRQRSQFSIAGLVCLIVICALWLTGWTIYGWIGLIGLTLIMVSILGACDRRDATSVFNCLVLGWLLVLLDGTFAIMDSFRMMSPPSDGQLLFIREQLLEACLPSVPMALVLLLVGIIVFYVRYGAAALRIEAPSILLIVVATISFLLLAVGIERVLWNTSPGEMGLFL